MSKIGKQPVKIPSGVDIHIDDVIRVKGPKGELQREKPHGFNFELKDGFLNIIPEEKTLKQKKGRALWGLYRSLISNMAKGVSDGFEKSLEFEGVGYRATLKGNDLELSVGFSHPVIIKAPEGVTFKVEKNKITVSGHDKEQIGHVAAKIRSVRPPEPYKGKGIRYEGEVIRRKAGKKTITAG